MKWQEAQQGINSIITSIASHGKGKMEIHITPRESNCISVAVIAGKTIEFLVEKGSIVEED